MLDNIGGRWTMRTLIYSFLYRRPETTNEQLAAMLALLDLWLAHLRGPGRYAGDVLLFTNVPELENKGIRLLPLGTLPSTAKRAFLHRITCSEYVPIDDYDVAMQLDLDILAVDDVNPMFEIDDRLWAATSQLRMLDWRHAWTLLPRWQRALHKYSGWRMDEIGACACVIASRTCVWDRNFGEWRRLVRKHEHLEPPNLADQSFLNLLKFERNVEVALWPPGFVCHRDWDNANGARLLHFPGSGKKVMAKYSRC